MRFASRGAQRNCTYIHSGEDIPPDTLDPLEEARASVHGRRAVHDRLEELGDGEQVGVLHAERRPEVVLRVWVEHHDLRRVDVPHRDLVHRLVVAHPQELEVAASKNIGTMYEGKSRPRRGWVGL